MHFYRGARPTYCNLGPWIHGLRLFENALLPGRAPHLLQFGLLDPWPQIVRKCTFTWARAPLVAIWAPGCMTSDCLKMYFYRGARPTYCNLGPWIHDLSLFENTLLPGRAPHLLQFGPLDLQFGPHLLHGQHNICILAWYPQVSACRGQNVCILTRYPQVSACMGSIMCAF